MDFPENQPQSKPRRQRKEKSRRVEHQGGWPYAEELSTQMGQVQELVDLGYSTPEIAEELKIDVRTVRRNVKMLADNWRARHAVNYEEMLLREIQKLDYVQALAQRRFEMSCEVGDESVVTNEDSEHPKTVTVEKTKRSGDKGWLVLQLQCIQLRVRIIMDRVFSHQENLNESHVQNMSMDELHTHLSKIMKNRQILNQIEEVAGESKLESKR